MRKPPTRGAPGLLLDLVRCLEPADLEKSLLEALLERLPGATALVSLQGRTPRPSRIASDRGVHRFPAGAPVPPLVAVPVMDRGEMLGWVGYADDEALGDRRDAALAALREVAEAAGIPARNARRHAATMELALRDPLTGLFNRRAFEAFLDREVHAARRYRRPLAVLMVDLDRFKEINDRLGHAAGDEALRCCARAVEKTIRRADVAARLGGDEFAILLPWTTARNAVQLGGRLLSALEEEPLELAEPRPARLVVGASLGAADLEQAGGRASRLLELADLAMFEAKRAGGRRVAGGPPPAGPLPPPHLPEDSR
ncbi:MAG: GGDEF domain-containing protein [Acidobacteria bacterium]|nr:MAG: GGDEF domain-containing protein [Acidobacteriota bacterium]